MPSSHLAAVAYPDPEGLWPSFVATVHDYALLLLDPYGRIMSWNHGAELIKGYRADEIVGRHFSCFYPPEDIAALRPQRELEIAAASHERARKLSVERTTVRRKSIDNTRSPVKGSRFSGGCPP